MITTEKKVQTKSENDSNGNSYRKKEYEKIDSCSRITVTSFDMGCSHFKPKSNLLLWINEQFLSIQNTLLRILMHSNYRFVMLIDRIDDYTSNAFTPETPLSLANNGRRKKRTIRFYTCLSKLLEGKSIILYARFTLYRSWT